MAEISSFSYQWSRLIHITQGFKTLGTIEFTYKITLIKITHNRPSQSMHTDTRWAQTNSVTQAPVKYNISLVLFPVLELRAAIPNHEIAPVGAHFDAKDFLLNQTGLIARATHGLLCLRFSF